MTSPEPLRPGSRRKNYLERYLKVQVTADARISAALESAALSAEQAIAEVAGKNSVSARVRYSQLVTARRTIRRILMELFSDVYDVIKDGQSQAASAAVEAQNYDDRSILRRIFPKKSEREDVIAAMEQVAEHNVQAMMTRILKTERPLSQRVYRSRALASGQVDKIINDRLARGASAREIAKAVKDSILPSTPGGVGYAAKRLGRTEINNAFHAQAQANAMDRPWCEEMGWHLSKSHRTSLRDKCEVYAQQYRFPVGQVPDKPHPNCLCYITPILIPYDQFEQDLLLGVYDDWIKRTASE